MRIINTIILGIILAIAGSSHASDLDREARLAGEIVDSIMDGDPLELTANDHKFLGIYTPASGDSARGSVLILHGRGFHPDWVNVVQPLRVGLVEHDWNTLSIQLPVLEKQAKYNQYVPLFAEAAPRIEAAIRYLREQGDGPVIMIAHSCGYHMANHWLLGKSGAAGKIDGLIGIGMGATDYQQPMQEPFALDKLTIPVLDIYGRNDYPAVLRLAQDRAILLNQAETPNFDQIEVPGADHYFTDYDEQLLEVVSTWLGKTSF